MMIGVTISGKAYAAVVATLPARSAVGELAADGEYRIWLPQNDVKRLRSLRQPGETFSDVILRLVERGSFAAIMRQFADLENGC